MVNKKIPKKLYFSILLGAIVLIPLIFVICNINIEFQMSSNTIQNTNIEILKTSTVYYENYIRVDDSLIPEDGYKDWSDTVSDYDWCTYNGGEDTYYIENVIIDGGGDSNYLIVIRESSEKFVIRNCTVYNSGSSGIILYDVHNGKVTGNNFSYNNNNGIYLIGDDYNNEFEYNNCSNNGNDGIFIDNMLGNSYNNNISNNTCYNNDQNGINIDSDDNTVQNNTCSENVQNGIQINSDGNTVDDNTCNDNFDNGIFFDTSNNNPSIAGNTCNDNGDNGIFLSSSDNNPSISGNTANGNDDAGIFLRSCRTTVSWNNELSSNTISNNKYGIHLYYSRYNYIGPDNEASGNTQYGIYLTDKCTNNNITGNLVDGNGAYGIFLYDGCNDNYIISNTVSGNTEYDICYKKGDEECIDNIFLNNNIKEVDLDNLPTSQGFRWEYVIAILVLLGFLSFIGGLGYLKIQRKKHFRINNIVEGGHSRLTYVRPGLVIQEPRIRRSDTFLPVEITEHAHSHEGPITPKEIDPYEFYCAKCDQKSLGYQVFCSTCGERMKQPKLAAMHDPNEKVQCVICHAESCPTCNHEITGDDACYEECPYCERSYHKHCWEKTMHGFGKCGFCLETPPPELMPNSYK